MIARPDVAALALAIICFLPHAAKAQDPGEFMRQEWARSHGRTRQPSAPSPSQSEELAEQGIASFVGPSGKPAYEVKCSRAPVDCYQKANKACKGPYQILDSESHAGGLLADVLPGPVTWYRMTFSCGPSDGRLPTFAFRGPRPSIPVAPMRQPTVTNCQVYGAIGMVSCRSY